ncbi:carbohydrate kinase [Leucobacter albus]|uniref:Carbohydrate kinase n=1 Tax=Leucobacter albus TaxID=272210 RepID=A0ABW3TS18_9MICO
MSEQHTEPSAGHIGERVLVVGEALIDVVVHPDGSREGVAGGSPANVALGLARLGARPDFLSHIGQDADGEHILTRLRASGVRVLPETVGAARTPTAEVTLDSGGHASYRFEVSWELPETANIDLGAALHVGSYSAFMEPGAARVSELALRAHAFGVPVSFDPNIRPALIGARADVRARFERIARVSTVVKLSDEDARWLFPGETLEATIARVSALGPALVAVTRGGDGALLASRAETVPVEPPAVNVVDTIGAGDSFMAALVAESLARYGMSATELAGLGAGGLTALGEVCVAAAAITVGRRGAELPTRAELRAGAE